MYKHFFISLESQLSYSTSFSIIQNNFRDIFYVFVSNSLFRASTACIIFNTHFSLFNLRKRHFLLFLQIFGSHELFKCLPVNQVFSFLSAPTFLRWLYKRIQTFANSVERKLFIYLVSISFHRCGSVQGRGEGLKSGSFV